MLESPLELMASICLIGWGLSYSLRPAVWQDWIMRYEQFGKPISLSVGSAHLVAGSFIVVFHPVWQGVPVLLTLLGVLALMKAALYLLFPQSLSAMLNRLAKRMKPTLQFTGLALFVIGLLLLDYWMVTHKIPGWPEMFLILRV